MEIDIDRVMRLLRHAVIEADGWHYEVRGSLIEDDLMINEARALIDQYTKEHDRTITE